ncbi:MAG TPA: flagellar basal body-associated protein FliL [Pararobbsia sp.]|jgi:flagellar FliL protein|nr:flagellar basal body-associated protein FliL [Pararobbsia sp.]
MASTTEAPRASGKNTLVIILVAVLVLVLAGGGAAFWMLSKKASGATTPAAVKIPPPVFFTLEPFTVNLISDDGQRYVHVGLTLRLADPEDEPRLTEHMPELRSRILLLLSNKHPEDLISLDGKQKLAAEIVATVDQPFSNGGPANHVAEVLFTEFVVQ